jgi:1-phosphofructokinase
MIYTVTFNPSVDYVINFREFKLGKINRVSGEKKYAGGKGINVSRVLKNIGVNSTAFGFIGGFTGRFIKDALEDSEISTDFINVKEDTRINVKLKSEVETEINAAGPQISEDDIEKLMLKVKNLNENDFIVLSGNVQKSVPRNIYSMIQQNCKGVKFVVDTTGEALMSTLEYKPFLIKPNIHELGDLFNRNIEQISDVVEYSGRLRKMGAQNVIVSMGGSGALLVCEKGVYRASAPEGSVVNSVGAGDSLVAGFLGKYIESQNVVEAFKFGAASGSATAFSSDLCTREEVERLLGRIEVVEL